MFFPPEGNFDWRRGWEWGGAQDHKRTLKNKMFLFFPPKGTLSDAGDGYGGVKKTKKKVLPKVI